MYTISETYIKSYRLLETPTSLNISAATETGTNFIVNMIKPILSAETYLALAGVLAYTNIFVAVAGIITNILVIITYTKIGFSESINITYLALGISDLGASVFRAWGSLCFVFDIASTNLPFHPTSIAITTSFYPAQGLEKTTAFLTAFLAFERCLCVQFPLHVRTIVTRQKTMVSILVIYFFVFGPSNLSFIVCPFKWIFNHDQNRIVLATVPLQNNLRFIITRALIAFYGSVLHFIALITVWICTIFLAIGLKKKADSRIDSFKHSKDKQDRKKESHVIKMVFLISVTYLACSTPIAATLLVPHFVPEFESTRALARINLVTHMFSALMAQLNSTVNLFIFLYMGSRFRQTFLTLFKKY
ncbi:chemosensory receptor a [Plakobranchus ocellatus]|uniref:Chemosensory receptor a n=1 Tax=Plakobranchus ocellatus TaxID=259542 RepID=A0AAV4C811_9GAST|nr:chemosensory receptor a [Plakobranchus ocellatus]